MLIAATSLALASLAPFQTPLAEVSRDELGHLGWILYDVGDLDGDGRDELAAAYAGRYLDDTCCSVVNVFSVSPGARKRHGGVVVALERASDWYRQADACGEALVVLRHDEGGFEIAVGAPGSGHEGQSCGAVETFTSLGDEGPRLHWIGGPAGDEFGAALALVPDLDRDARPDLAIGVPGVGDGRVVISSTNEGALIETLPPAGANKRFGAALAWTFDIEPDGARGRLAVGAPDDASGEERKGAVHLYDLGDRKLVRSIEGARAGEHFGARVVSDDLEGDGAEELVVGALGEEAVPARVSVIRNATVERVWVHELADAASADGLRLSTCADLDGDGTREVLVTFVPEEAAGRPELLVLSGRDGTIVHAIRGIDPVLDESGERPARVYRADDLGLPLGRHIGAVDAGDQDGDGVHDVWFTAGSGGKGGARMQASLALLSGKDLGATEKPAPSRVDARVVVPKDAPAAAQERGVVVAPIDELPLHVSIGYGDELSGDDRGWMCTDSAFGKQVDAVGDLDGDGRDELWVSGIGAMWEEYQGFLFSGSDGRELQRWNDGDFGRAARIGDLDGDGRDELVLAASERTYRFCEMIGEALVVSSAKKKPLYEIRHPGGAIEFGAVVEAIGDLDGDGLRDVAISTPEPGGWGRPEPDKLPHTCEVSLVACGKDGATVVHTLKGDASGAEQFGRALAYGGDWDGDGVADLAVGAPRECSGAARGGAVHVFSGASWTRIAWFASGVPNERLGSELEWTGDLDGDGRSELIVAAPLSGADRRGRIVVLASKTGKPLYQRLGQRPCAAFGTSLALGDFDRDGTDELVVGAPGVWSGGELEPGAVSILALRDGRELVRIVGGAATLVDFMDGVEWTGSIDITTGLETKRAPEPPLPLFGHSVSIARDLDGDGGADLVIGEPMYLGPEHAGSVVAISGRELGKQMKLASVERTGPAPRDVRVAVLEGAIVGLDAAVSIAIEDVQRMATLEHWEADRDASACSTAAYGRGLLSVGDLVGPAGDDLMIVGRGQGLDDDGVELRALAGDLGWEEAGDRSLERVWADIRIDSVVPIAKPPCVAIGSGQMSGYFCFTTGRIRVAGGETAIAAPRGPGGIQDDFASLVADAGDVDKDGVHDLLVQYRGLRLHSGATGECIDDLGFRIERPAGAKLLAARDLDRDGHEEFVIGEGPFDRVTIVSGETRGPATVLHGPSAESLFGSTLAWAPDLDGDGIAELAVGAPWAGATRRGAAYVISSRTLEPLTVFEGERDFGALGRSIVADHDLDGDGVRDIVLGAPGGCGERVRGAVYVVSGRERRVLLRIDGESDAGGYPWGRAASRPDFPESDAFGWSLATGDFDADGLADLAIGSPQRTARGKFPARADTNGGGIVDVAFGPGFPEPQHCTGIVYVIGGVTLRELLARAR